MKAVMRLLRDNPANVLGYYVRESFPHGRRSDRTRLWLINHDLARLEEAIPVLEELKLLYPSFDIIVSQNKRDRTRAAYSRLRRQEALDGLRLLPTPLVEISCKEFFRRYGPDLIYLSEHNVLQPDIVDEAMRHDVPIIRINFFLTRRFVEKIQEKNTGILDEMIQPAFRYCIFNQETRRLLLSRGVPESNITTTGYTKMERDYPPPEVRVYHEVLGASDESMTRVVFGSLSEREYRIVATVCREVLDQGLKARFVLAPRKTGEINIAGLERECQRCRLASRRMSRADDAAPSDVLIYDDFGGLSGIYASSNIVLIGDSFSEDSLMGHNFMEACALSKPVVFGASMGGMQPYADTAVERGAAIMVRGERQLADTLAGLIGNRRRREEMGRAGRLWYSELKENRAAAKNIARQIHSLATGRAQLVV